MNNYKKTILDFIETELLKIDFSNNVNNHLCILILNSLIKNFFIFYVY